MNKKTKNDKVEFMDKVKKFIKEKKLINSGEHIIVGVSGGADSVCLLRILYSMKDKLNLKITAVHINHMIRDEAVDDEKFVEDLCGKLSIPCISFKMDVKMIAQREKKTLEEAGRKARYDVFYKIMKKYHADKIAVAHHQNDQAETIFISLRKRYWSLWSRCNERERWSVDSPSIVCKKTRNRRIFTTDRTNMGGRCKQSG